MARPHGFRTLREGLILQELSEAALTSSFRDPNGGGEAVEALTLRINVEVPSPLFWLMALDMRVVGLDEDWLAQAEVTPPRTTTATTLQTSEPGWISDSADPVGFVFGTVPFVEPGAYDIGIRVGIDAVDYGASPPPEPPPGGTVAEFRDLIVRVAHF